jgi:hypothetical protein
MDQQNINEYKNLELQTREDGNKQLLVEESDIDHSRFELEIIVGNNININLIL